MARGLPCEHGMTQPREVLPGQFYLLTRRCTQRQFLLRPDPDTNNAFTYCLAVAAQKYDIDVPPVGLSSRLRTEHRTRHGLRVITCM